MSYVVKLVNLDDHQEIARCFCVFAVLRPHLIEADFVELVQVQAKEGYRIAYKEMHLDTGFTRHDAHGLYLNKGFMLSSHHLAKTSE